MQSLSIRAHIYLQFFISALAFGANNKTNLPNQLLVNYTFSNKSSNLMIMFHDDDDSHKNKSELNVYVLSIYSDETH